MRIIYSMFYNADATNETPASTPTLPSKNGDKEKYTVIANYYEFHISFSDAGSQDRPYLLELWNIKEKKVGEYAFLTMDKAKIQGIIQLVADKNVDGLIEYFKNNFKTKENGVPSLEERIGQNIYLQLEMVHDKEKWPEVTYASEGPDGSPHRRTHYFEDLASTPIPTPTLLPLPSLHSVRHYGSNVDGVPDSAIIRSGISAAQIMAHNPNGSPIHTGSSSNIPGNQGSSVAETPSENSICPGSSPR